MEYEKPKVRDGKKEYDFVSMEEFREIRNLPNISNQTLNYAIKHDHIDFVKIHRFKFIVYNEKAVNWTPSEAGRPREVREKN
jgi:hypothetical protein